MSVDIDGLRKVIHCINQCGPDGSLQNCEGLGLTGEARCEACLVLDRLPDSGTLYDEDDLAEISAGEDW